MKMILSLKLFFVSCALLMTTSCATVDPVTGNKVYNLWTIDDDVRMGVDVYNDILSTARQERMPVNQDRQRVAQITRIMNDITAVSHMPDLPYEISLIHSDIVNAYAMPGGKFVVFSGLYDPRDGMVQDEDELAFVIAHEIAHVNCRHSTRALTAQLPVNLLLMGGMAYAAYKDNDDLQLALGAAFLIHEGLIMTKYSRKHEREADEVGLMYMARAGYDPQAAVRLWERAAQQYPDPGMLSVLSTHPPSSQRASRLRGRLPEAMAAYEQALAMGVRERAPGKPPAKALSMRDDPGPRWAHIPDPERALVSPRANAPRAQGLTAPTRRTD